MPSIKHNALSAMGLCWMASRCRAFRGAAEVSVAPGFVADAACVSGFFWRHLESYCNQWGLKPKTWLPAEDATPFCTATAASMTAKLSDRDDGVVVGDVDFYLASVFEAKATRADFLSTFGGRANDHANRASPVAHLHWIVIEKGVCTPEEVPGHWGLLQRRGRGLSELKIPTYRQVTPQQLAKIESALLWKPDSGVRTYLSSCPACNGDLQHARHNVPWKAVTPDHLDAAVAGKAVRS